MKKALLAILALIGVLAVLAMTAFVALALIAALRKPSVPGRIIVEIDFERGVIEGVPDDPLARLMLDGMLEVHDVVDALDRAAGDRRVRGVIARIGAGGMGLAHIQEIRDAVIRFRESGKPALAFAETFGEFASGNGGYYLATAFDEIYMQPTGDIGLTGLAYETMFVAGTLEKLDVVARMDQRHEYKNAMNMYTETEMTPAHREAMQELVDSQLGQVVRGIAAARGLDEATVQELVDRGPYLGQEALDAGLVDVLAYRDEVHAEIRERAGERARLLYLTPYLERAGRPRGRGPTVALVHGFGAVTRGSSAYAPMSGQISMGSDSVASALRAAIDDDRVQAIVFRVDSPGGSYVASDTIWRETIRAREVGKPVIVSMGNLAASGGYFVSMDADKIVAQPGTITASIGVLGGKLLTGGLWDKFGVSFDEVHSGANATYWSGIEDYNDHGYSRFQAGLDRIYDDFTQKVANGRALPLEQVQQIARGRIWTGEDALELGLVDALGGYHTAFRLAREAIGLDADDSIRIRRYPAERSTLDLWFGGTSDNSEGRAVAAMTGALRAVQPLGRMLTRTGLTGPQAVLRAVELEPVRPTN